MKKTIYFRRKREGRTDYKKRLILLKSGKPRLVIRKSVKNITVQIVEYSDKGDRILAGSSSLQLRKMGWKFNTGNIPSAYLAGYLCGKKYKGREIVLDAGLRKPTKLSRIYAAVQGVIDSGVMVVGVKDAFADKEKLYGKGIQDYFSFSRENQFSQYRKLGLVNFRAEIERLKGGK